MSTRDVYSIDYDVDKKVNVSENFLGTLLPINDLLSLKKDILHTLGTEKTRDFFYKYGWHCGVNDAQIILDIYKNNIETALMMGPKFHYYKGYLGKIKTINFKKNSKIGNLQWEAIWDQSYEVKEQLEGFGQSDTCVCHTIVGYVSAYVSKVIGENVLVNEIECQAMGHEYCRAVCYTEKELNGDGHEEIKLLSTIGETEKFEKDYELIKSERDNLIRSNIIYEKLLQQTYRDDNLSKIANVLNKETNLSVLIEDLNQNVLAIAGSLNIRGNLNPDIRMQTTILKTKYLTGGKYGHRLITPIFIKNNVVGYCSFVYQNTVPQELDKLILERAASVCSINLFKESIRLDTEQNIQSELLNGLIQKKYDMHEFSKRASYFSFELENSYSLIALQQVVEQSLNSYELKVKLIDWIILYFKNRNINVLVSQRQDIILILISNEKLVVDAVKMNKYINSFYQECIRKIGNDNLLVGISSMSNTLDDVHQMYEESIACLKVANGHKKIISFDSLGMVGFLLQMKNPKIIEKYRLNNLLEEDRNKNTALIKTLYHYLNNGSNLNKTARVMNFSISGLRYRIQRLNEILELDINKPDIASQVFLALQYMIILEDLDVQTGITY